MLIVSVNGKKNEWVKEQILFDFCDLETSSFSELSPPGHLLSYVEAISLWAVLPLRGS